MKRQTCMISIRGEKSLQQQIALCVQSSHKSDALTAAISRSNKFHRLKFEVLNYGIDNLSCEIDMVNEPTLRLSRARVFKLSLVHRVCRHNWVGSEEGTARDVTDS